jgi:hypothetical protein
MKNFCCTLVISMCTFLLLAQDLENVEIEQFIIDLFEHYAAELDEAPDFESFFEELLVLASQPIELNSANRHDLERIPFLSQLQIENILYYRYTYGHFTTLYELQLIEGLDMTDIRRMLPFVRLGDAPLLVQPLRWWEVKKYGRHELYLRNDFIPEKKKGYHRGEVVVDLSEDELLPLTKSLTSPAYAGDRIYSSLKYRFNFRNRVRFSMTAEKDAGEPWWDSSNGGVDFLSASLQLRSLGPFENIVVGDFSAGFGQGLVIQQGFRRGKSSLTTQVMNVSNGFKRYASTNEHQFFRGVAGSMRLQNVVLNAFVSHRLLNATMENGIFRSIYTSGNHRTFSERAKKNQVEQQVCGMNIHYSKSNYELGLSAIYTTFSEPLEPVVRPYNHFYFKGKRQFTTGIHYRYRYQVFNFFGETALSHWPYIATINGLSFSPASRISLAIVQRYYHERYNALFASSFSSQSRITNEQGVYAGVEVYPVARWKIAAYADSYRFSWFRFGTDGPSTGNDGLLHVYFTPSRRMQLSTRFRYRQQFVSQRTPLQSLVYISDTEKWSARLQLDYSTDVVQIRNVVDMSYFLHPAPAVEHHIRNTTVGFASWQDISTQLPSIPLNLSVRYMFFNVPDYNNRVYAYEKDVLHAFSSPSFSGKGSRYYLLFSYTLSESTRFWLKISQLKYADGRKMIGSGYEQINGNKRTEIRLLMRIKFRSLTF